MTRKISLSIITCWLMCLLLSLFAGCSALAANDLQTGDLGDGFTWEYNPGTNTLTISGEGVMPDFDWDRFNAGEYWHSTSVIGSGSSQEYLYHSVNDFDTLIIDDGVTEISSMLRTVNTTCETMVIGEDLSSDNGLGGLVTEQFVVDENNDYFTLYDDALYSQNGTKLVSCPMNKTSIEFKSGITEIGDRAFDQSKIYGTLVIPWGIEALGEQPFYYMGLTQNGGVTVILPDTLSSIHNSFGDRYNNVYYIFSSNMVACEEVYQAFRDIGFRVGDDDAWMVDSVAEYYPDDYAGLAYENGKAYIYDENGNKLHSGWYQAGSDWYYLNDNGAGVVNCWRLKDGTYRYLKSDGKMARNEWILDYGDTYYVQDDGARLESAWYFTDNRWYWFGGSGKMMKNGWLKLDGIWYYFDEDGAMANGVWRYVGGKWYYLTGSGAMATNRWVQTGGLWYYVGSDGARLMDTTTPDGYYVNADGVWVS